MLEAKTEKELLRKKTPFSNYFNPFEQYKMKLDNNAYLLRNQFPSQKLSKIRELLEQLDNNLQMATQILEEECEKSEAIVPQRPIKLKIPEGQENKILKNAVSRLYNKLIKTEKELENVKSSNESLKKENDTLRMQNTIMMNNQFCQNRFDPDNNVY